MKLLKYIIIILFFALISQSCNRNIEINNNVIPQDTMAMLIADIHIADATLNVIMNTEKFKDVDVYYASVLKKYNVSRMRFDTSISIYTSNPDIFNKIYEDVMLILSQKEGSVLALPEDKKANIKTPSNFRNICSIKSNFDTKTSKNYLLDKKSNVNANSGKYSLLFNTNTLLSNKLSYNFDNVRNIKINMSFFIKLIGNKATLKRPLLIIEVKESNNKVIFEKIDIYKYISTQGDWDKVAIKNSFKLKKLVKKGEINIFISNVFNQEFFIDDLDLKIDVN